MKEKYFYFIQTKSERIQSSVDLQCQKMLEKFLRLKENDTRSARRNKDEQKK